MKARFYYGIEYLVYFKQPIEDGDLDQLMHDLWHSGIRTNRITSQYISILGQEEVMNKFVHCPYKFFDCIVKEVQAFDDSYITPCVIRQLDECELAYINSIPHLIDCDATYKVDNILQILGGDKIQHHGWYKVRELH